MSSPNISDTNCPSCGAATPPLLKHSKLAVCAYCNSTLFIEDAQVASAGEKSVLTEIPSILRLGQQFQVGNWIFEPVGRIRYEYGASEGYWDEWWVQLSTGSTKWISNDEGEYVIENEVDFDGEVPAYEQLEIGASIQLLGKDLRVTEINHATCIGIEGQLPEIVNPGDTHRYAHLEGQNSELVTTEYEEDAIFVFEGVWLDPFEIKVA